MSPHQNRYPPRQGREKPHAFQILGKEIKEKKISSPLFFFGTETYLIRWATDALTELFVSPGSALMDRTVLDLETDSGDRLRESCETFPLFSEKRLVIARNLSAPDENLARFLSGLPEHCLLIFTAGSVDRRTKGYKACAACWKEYDFGRLGEEDLKKFIEKRVRQGGKAIDPSLTAEIIRRSGYLNKDSEYRLHHLENDITKILYHSGEDRVSAADVEASMAETVESGIYDCIDHAGAGRKDEALSMLFRLLRSGESLYYILALLIGQWELLLQVKELKREGYGAESMARILDVHSFRVKKALGAAERFSEEALRRHLGELYEIDGLIKSGQMEGTLALELLIAGL